MWMNHYSCYPLGVLAGAHKENYIETSFPFSGKNVLTLEISILFFVAIVPTEDKNE